MDLAEILKRKQEIRSILNSNQECDIDALENELRELDEAQQKIEKRKQLAQSISTGAIIPNEIEKPFGKAGEERSYGVDSQEYRSAFFKTLAGVELNDAEKRAMTTNASSSVRR